MSNCNPITAPGQNHSFSERHLGICIYFRMKITESILSRYRTILLLALLMNISSNAVLRYPRGALWLLLGVAGKENAMVVQGLHIPSRPLTAKEEHSGAVWVCTKVNINVHDSYWNLYYLNYLFLCYSEGQLTEIKHCFSWYSLLKLQQ